MKGKWKRARLCVFALRTSSDPQHSHDPDDGGVDGQGGVDLNLLQGDAHD